MTNRETPGRIRIGTCAWADHERFYPAGLRPNERLAYYARHFSIVEVDAAYYSIQPARNYAAWAERTPADFRFIVKAYRELTWHDRDQPPRPETFASVRASMAPLREAGKLRAVLFQFPPWFVASQASRDYLASLTDHLPDDVIAIEFRHRSWFDDGQAEATLSLLRDLGLAHSVVDAPQIGAGTAPIVPEVTHPSLAIVRFHGRNTTTWYKRVQTTGERFNYLYSRDELAEWVPRVRTLAEKAEEVHLLMNNNAQNFAVTNARDLMELLGQPFSEPRPQLAFDL